MLQSHSSKDNPLFNYKCPNGLPPEECGHFPQLILNAVSYFKKKQQLRKEIIQNQSQKSVAQTGNAFSTTTTKTRRRG
jgi:hypothetical protein